MAVTNSAISIYTVAKIVWAGAVLVGIAKAACEDYNASCLESESEKPGNNNGTEEEKKDP